MDERDTLKSLLNFCDALLSSMNTVIAPSGNGPHNISRYAGYKIYIRKYNQLVHVAKKIDPQLTELLDAFAEDLVPSPSNAVLDQHKEYFSSVHAMVSMLKASLENRLGVKEDKIQALVDFFDANLRRAVHSSPEKEKDIQDIVEALLIGKGFEKGLDYDREVGAVKFSIKEMVPDFVMRKLNLAIEIKLSKDTKKSKQIVDEINADIIGYQELYSRCHFDSYFSLHLGFKFPKSGELNFLNQRLFRFLVSE